MAVMIKRWYRSRRNQFIVFITLTVCLVYYTVYSGGVTREDNLDLTRRSVDTFQGKLVVDYKETVVLADLRRSSIVDYIQNKLQEALKYDKGTGCEIPVLNPFAKEVYQFFKNATPITCKSKDWVRCYYSECKVQKEILETTKDLVCTYRDIIYYSDQKYDLGAPVDVYGDNIYTLTRSDHVKVKCMGRHAYSILPSKWLGVSTGFRKLVDTPPVPPSHKDAINVLIFGYDSMSKNGFIRHMPKTYKYITEELKMTILNGYNIVGDGTPAALFPILSGTTELEQPDVRKKTKNNNRTLDVKKFIFYRLKQYGYRTAYFEDSPSIGTFQYRFNGFNAQPSDHYLRAFYQEDGKTNHQQYCVGERPRYQLMLNLTEQVVNYPDTKRYVFSFIADITHDDFNMISNADESTVEFFKSFKEKGHLKDTLLMFMGDHGTRYATVRKTLQGRLEERLPLMAVLLPEDLLRNRPSAQKALESNAQVLTTPHDIYATVVDALNLSHLTPDVKIPGADLPRAMSLLEPIPNNRSCSEAGVEPHWCACVSWRSIEPAHPMYTRTAQALLHYINNLTEFVRSECVPRTLTNISWVMKQQTRKGVMEFQQAKDVDGYVGKFGSALKPDKENYQVKITVGPGTGVFEGTVAHITHTDQLLVESRDISRTNMYHHEPDCIHLKHPHLNPYCYCKNQVNPANED